jgi:Mrp family chromosome partitioning ATPase
MNTTMRRALAAGAMLLAGAASAGTATVTFAKPDRYSDLPMATIERDRILEEVSEHFKLLAAKLPEGQELKVEVLDLDLAGTRAPYTMGMNETRILRGEADWPMMTIRYQIMQDGKVLKSGDETIKDMAYLAKLNGYSSGDSLRYEKRMLDAWFKTVTAAR